MIIGVTGKYCSGKDAVSDYLKQKGFITFSLSDMLREKLKESGKEATRDLLINLGNSLREKHGPGVLGKLAREKIESGQRNGQRNFCISSVRTPGEVRELKKLACFELISVDASEEIRFSRMKARNRENDPKTIDEFRKKEKLETEGTGENSQRLNDTIALADRVIFNEGTFEELQKKIEKIIGNSAADREFNGCTCCSHDCGKVELDHHVSDFSSTTSDNYDHASDFKKKRDDWDVYFMKIAREVAKRSTCFAGTKHGAVAVKERQIISTGYNGAPRKTMDCYERGVCIRRQLKIPSGQRYELCRSVHGEMNVIINAARSGVSLTGSEVYVYSIKSYGGEYKVIDAAPCFICKKMLINAGVVKVHCQMSDGSIKTMLVEDWQNDWRKGDMLDDMHIYDSNYYEGKDEKTMTDAATLGKADKNSYKSNDNNNK